MRPFTFCPLSALAFAASSSLCACGADASKPASAAVAVTRPQAPILANDCHAADASSSQKGCRPQRTLVGSK